MFRLFLTLPFIVSACLPDETISGYADPDAIYYLQELDGAQFAALATISFPKKGSIRGDGACNSYFASQSAPYPWLDLGPITATRATCTEQPQETQFFTALAQMTLVEVLDDLIILRNDDNREMVFRIR